MLKEITKKITAMFMAVLIITNMILPSFTFAEEVANETETEEIGTEYEIKAEEEWDISKNEDGSIIAKWTLKDKTLRISGNGDMKDWSYSSTGEMSPWYEKYGLLIEDVSIGNNIMNIGSYAFYGCSNLQEITIPEGVSSIGSQAFYGCSSLQEITIPEGVTSIGEHAFDKCSGLNKIIIPDGVTGIERYTFRECENLESIIIPKNLKYIRQGAFSGCKNLKIIDIPEKIESLSGEEFNDCNSLREINVSENNNSLISIQGVLYTKDLRRIIKYPAGKEEVSYKIEENTNDIDGYAFNQCANLRSIIIPSGITNIKRETFRGCSNLVSIVIPQGVTTIGEYAFKECSSLKEIVIPEGVTSILSAAFGECSSLQEIKIPNSVTNIGIEAFKGCNNLIEIELPDNIVKIAVSSVPESALIKCKANTETHKYLETNGICYILMDNNVSLTVETVNEIKAEEEWDLSKENDGSVIGKWTFEDKTLRIYGKGEMKGWKQTESRVWAKKYGKLIEKIIIEDGITDVGSYAFKYCSKLREVELAETVVKIKDSAFINCESLKKINIPEGLISIGVYAFQGCSSLEKIYIPEGTTNIGYFTFCRCRSLQEIIIPETVEHISTGAFSGCKSLKEIVVPKNVTSIGNRAFEGCTNLENIFVNENNIEYISKEGVLYTRDKKEIIAYPPKKNDIEYKIEDTVRKIDSSAFKSCENLEKIAIPEGVTSIGMDTFTGCSRLQEIIIPSSVTSIGQSAFWGCSSLKRIFIPESVVNISPSSGIDSYIVCHPNSEAHKYAEENKIFYMFGLTSDKYNVKEYRIKAINFKTKIEDIISNITVPKYSKICDKNMQKLQNTDIAKTGDKIVLYDSLEYSLVVTGDVDGDGKVNISDLFATNKHRLTGNSLTGVYFDAGDINEDGKIDVRDMMEINKIRLGK